MAEEPVIKRRILPRISAALGEEEEITELGNILPRLKVLTQTEDLRRIDPEDLLPRLKELKGR